MKKIDSTIKLFDLPIFSGSKTELLNGLESHLLNSTKTTYIFTPNPEQLVLAEKEPRFKKVLQTGTILIPDGFGLLWATRILNLTGKTAKLPHRIGGRELTQDLLRLQQQHSLTALLIGGKDYTVDMFPGLTWIEGYADALHPTEEEEKKLKQTLAKLKPDLVFVAFGAPTQEYWVNEHRTELEAAGVKVVLVVGGSFDVLLGHLSPPPGWMQHGGEWLYRLIQQPWRWKRQVKLLEFIWMVLRRAV